MITNAETAIGTQQVTTREQVGIGLKQHAFDALDQLTAHLPFGAGYHSDGRKQRQPKQIDGVPCRDHKRILHPQRGERHGRLLRQKGFVVIQYSSTWMSGSCPSRDVGRYRRQLAAELEQRRRS
jgi:hypothetical protein